MKWNQKTIHKWGNDTFGNAVLNALGVAIRMSKEAIELSNVLMTMDDVDKISMESADVAIVLFQVANCVDFDVHAEDQAVEEVDDAIDTGIDAAMILNAAAVDLLSALFHGAEKDQVVLQIKKIMTCLGALEELYQFDLVEKIQEKMEINVARQWAKKEDGSFQHV